MKGKDNKVVPVLKQHTINTYEGVEIELHILLTLQQDVSGQLHALATLPLVPTE
jgi:hypothetical protein